MEIFHFPILGIENRGAYIYECIQHRSFHNSQWIILNLYLKIKEKRFPFSEQCAMPLHRYIFELCSRARLFAKHVVYWNCIYFLNSCLPIATSILCRTPRNNEHLKERVGNWVENSIWFQGQIWGNRNRVLADHVYSYSIPYLYRELFSHKERTQLRRIRRRRS